MHNNTECYENPVGLWKVTTEGDCEARTVNVLGIYQGHVLDIAKKLATKAYYKLTFHAVNVEIVEPETKVAVLPDFVHIGFDIDSGTWDLTATERQLFVHHLFKGRSEVIVEPGEYFASVKLDFASEVERLHRARQKALDKLTKEEKEILGL